MAQLARVRDFLSRKRLAIVGVSQQPNDFSRILFRELRQRGYDAVPVHPGGGEIEGQRSFPRVQDIQPAVEGALLMTSPGVTDKVVRDCAEAGIPRVWMYRATGSGAVSADAVAFCESHGIAVVPGECPMMFFDGAGLIHRFHGLVKRIAGSYPR